METKLIANFQTGSLEVSGNENFVKEIYLDFKNALKVEKLQPLKSNSIPNQVDSDIPQSKNSTRTKPARKPISSTLQIVRDLILKPSGKQSLKDFYSTFEVKSGYDKNLIFIYYMSKILEMNGITVNHVYTCYKDVGEKFPTQLLQNLRDTKRDKGWIETSDSDNIKVSPVGEMYLEHDMPKKEEKAKK